MQIQSHISLTALLPQTGRSPSKEVSSSDSDDQSGIAILNDRDDADIWKGWKRYLYTLTPALVLLNTGIYLTYLGLRIACVILAQKASGLTFAAAWVFIAVELAVAIPSLMHNTWTMWSLKKRNRPKMRLTGNDVPTVDAFITCCGEDDELVMDTVRGACDQDYPTDRFRVIVLDDGKSAGLERSCAILSHTYPNLYYMARTKVPGQPHHFKAGNLNYGLEQSALLPGGAGQFMAALDADMVSLEMSGRVKTRFIAQFSLTQRRRFPRETGFALCFLTLSWTPKWPWFALLSCSTTRPHPILWRSPWISLFTLSSPSRTPWASPGALDLVI